MAKSSITKYFEQRMRNRMTLEPPTAEEALDAIDYEKGIELIDRLQQLSLELDEWMTEYQYAVQWTNIPHWERGLNTLQPIRRELKSSNTWLDCLRRNFMRWSAKQSNKPNITYQIQQAI